MEIEDAEGRPIPDFSLADCPEVFGDDPGRTVTWAGGTDLGPLAGKAIRRRFDLRDADLYALRFAE